MGFSSIIAGALALASAVTALPAADASSADKCAPYKPVGWNSTKAKIYFYDNNPNDEPANGKGFHAPTLPANASAVSPWALSDHKTSAGSAFAFNACNVSSLGLTSPSTQSSCSHGGCYITYTNYIQVVNPATGHCLTSVKPYASANTTTLAFKKCVTPPTSKDQLWETDQQVLYSPGYGSITSYGTVGFNIIEPLDQSSSSNAPFLAWVLDRSNNKTIEIIHFPYTQDGLSASLLQA